MNCSLKTILIMLILALVVINNPGSAAAPQLVYSTFLGGRNNDGLSNWLNNFVVDKAGNIIFTTDTESSNFPVTENAYNKTYNGGNDFGGEDIVIIKFNLYDYSLQYASYFGGKAGPDFIEQVCMHGDDYYLVGNTGSSDYPVTANGYDRTFNGPVFRHADGIISRFHDNELVYSTFAGTSGNEFMSNILFAANDNMIIVGQVAKPDELDFTYSFSGDRSADAPNCCLFVFNSDGVLQSSSLFGLVWEIDAVIDDAGYIYIAGTTPNENFYTTNDVLDNTFNGGESINGGDIFIMKLSPQGDQVLFSTFLGGSRDELNPMIRLDPSNNLVIYGRTTSTDFPLTNDALDKTLTGSSDLFISKLSHDGKNLIYSSYLGGMEKSDPVEQNSSISISDNGSVYVAGLTNATDHPVTQNAMQSINNGGIDIFITVFDSTLKNIKYSTFFGGKSNEVGAVIALDNAFNIICIGATSSSNFPVTDNAYDKTKNGGYDVTISVLSAIEKEETNIIMQNQNPQDFLLYQNYPNPFNPTTTLRYHLSVTSYVNLQIYDILGHEVKTLVDSYQGAGEHSIDWNGTDNEQNPVSSGIYFYRLKSSDIILLNKMLLVR